MGNITSELVAARQFIDWCDKRQEHRRLTALELLTLSIVKQRYTYLSVLEEDLWYQRASLKWRLRGDRNTSYFHAVASGHKRKNFMKELKIEDEVHTNQYVKGQILFKHFSNLMGRHSDSMPMINWRSIFPAQQQNSFIQQLAQPISAQEIKEAIHQWPTGKMSGPDGFKGEFYKEFVSLLPSDLHATFQHVTTTGSSLHLLNNSYIVLLPNMQEGLTHHWQFSKRILPRPLILSAGNSSFKSRKSEVFRLIG